MPPDLEMICMKALAKQPERCFGTALELLKTWNDGCRRHYFTAVCHAKAARLALGPANPMSAAMQAAIAVLIVVVAIGSSVAAWNISVVRDRADAKAREAASAQLAENQAQQARAARDDADGFDAKQRVLVSSYVSNGTHGLDGGDMFVALALVWRVLH